MWTITSFTTACLQPRSGNLLNIEVLMGKDSSFVDYVIGLSCTVAMQI